MLLIFHCLSSPWCPPPWPGEIPWEFIITTTLFLDYPTPFLLHCIHLAKRQAWLNSTFHWLLCLHPCSWKWLDKNLYNYLFYFKNSSNRPQFLLGKHPTLPLSFTFLLFWMISVHLILTSQTPQHLLSHSHSQVMILFPILLKKLKQPGKKLPDSHYYIYSNTRDHTTYSNFSTASIDELCMFFPKANPWMYTLVSITSPLLKDIALTLFPFLSHNVNFLFSYWIISISI